MVALDTAERGGGGEQDGGVGVVAAGVHHPRALRPPRQVGRLLQRQRIHIGPQRDGRAGPVCAEHRNNAVLTGPADADPWL